MLPTDRTARRRRAEQRGLADAAHQRRRRLAALRASDSSQPGTVASAWLIVAEAALRLMSSAVMTVMMAGASCTVVTPLAAEVTTLARSISRFDIERDSSARPALPGSRRPTSGSATSCAQRAAPDEHDSDHASQHETHRSSRSASLLHHDELDAAVLRARLRRVRRVEPAARRRSRPPAGARPRRRVRIRSSRTASARACDSSLAPCPCARCRRRGPRCGRAARAGWPAAARPMRVDAPRRR